MEHILAENVELQTAFDPLEQIALSQQSMDTFIQMGEIQELEKSQSLHHAGEILENCYYVRSGELVAFEYTASGAERVFSVILLPNRRVGSNIVMFCGCRLWRRAKRPKLNILFPNF